MPDKFVLQHDRSGTIHQLKPGGKTTYCGNGNNGEAGYTRKRLSKANAHPQAHHCNTLACRANR
jgi:hypothetical protein